LILSSGLFAAGEALWVLSYLLAESSPLLPARAIWVWPLTWGLCTGIAVGLRSLAGRLTKPGTRDGKLAGGLLADLFGRTMLLGLPVLVIFFAGASVVASLPD
jgi:hypothetical protein